MAYASIQYRHHHQAMLMTTKQAPRHPSYIINHVYFLQTHNTTQTREIMCVDVNFTLLLMLISRRRDRPIVCVCMSSPDDNKDRPIMKALTS